MKTNQFITFLLVALFFVNCTSNKNSATFMKEASGRYYFNADEVIEVYFNNDELLLKWRNQNLTPLKVADNSFYVRELNEKLVFNTQEKNITLAEKREHKGEKFVFLKLKEGAKTPSEYLADNNYKKALEGYLTIKTKDSLNPVIRERSLNRLGYRYLRNDEFEKAMNVFKINIELYPKSSNTYDSMGDAYLKQKDTTNAIDYYKKALAINPENRNSKRAVEKLTKKKEN